MGNLGAYQTMTTLAKKVGGPIKLAILVFGSGVTIGGAAGTYIAGKFSKKNKKKILSVVYEVKESAKSNEGLVFNVNDKFRVLEIDGDVCLIEIIGNDNNPFFVSGDFLSKISEFKK